MNSDADHIARNLAAVRERLAAAARSAGRAPDDVRLVAVSKTFGADAVRAAWEAGQRDFGENKVQEALQKIDATADLQVRWHLIGHLQSNKARRAARAFALIQSIDSVDLLRKVDGAAAGDGLTPEVLIQVDLAGEATKFGAPEADVESIARAALECKAARLTGLMLLPPWSEDPEAARPYFRRLRALRDDLQARGVPATSLRELSMGMSHDFEVAIQEGATMVRVGTAIFGRRQVRQA
ncbi:MAG TPA: YggS family pyridoxal phosphate-dependent enzyme [Vicinamibacterales bacterium]|nr:YggS family pyridoxal phosphate-dependent enzyme [Vicinamibacterales bacterium]